jgi:hypothetical protein
MPNTLRVNIAASATGGMTDLLDFVRAVQTNARHQVITLTAETIPNPSGQFIFPDSFIYQHLLLVFGVPLGDGGEVAISCSGLVGNIVRCNYPSIASGDQLILLIPRTNEIPTVIIDISSTIVLDTVDGYFF